MADDLGSRIAEWIDSQGYPLEMHVGASLQGRGFTVVQSDYYKDPDTKALREIDLAALMQVSVAGLTVRFGLAIECKSSREKPWVMFTSERTPLDGPDRITERAASLTGAMLLKELAEREDIAGRPLYQVEKRPGYGLTQAFTSGSDVAFAATSTAAKAAIAIAREFDPLVPKSPAIARLLRVPSAHVLFPVVVIDAPLFECYLEGGASPTIAEIERGTLTWRNPIVGMPHTILHVVTRAGLSEFLDGARDSIVHTLGSCEREAARVVARWRDREERSSISFESWDM